MQDSHDIIQRERDRMGKKMNGNGDKDTSKRVRCPGIEGRPCLTTRLYRAGFCPAHDPARAEARARPRKRRTKKKRPKAQRVAQARSQGPARADQIPSTKSPRHIHIAAPHNRHYRTFKSSVCLRRTVRLACPVTRLALLQSDRKACSGRRRLYSKRSYSFP